MGKYTGIAFLVVGIILLGYGISASESLGSSFSKFFTGTPTDKAIWLMILGGVLTVFGSLSLFRGSRQA